MTTDGDLMGDADDWADELDDDEIPSPGEPFLTPEARAFTGAGFILAGLMGTGLFQFLSFFVLNDNNGGAARWLQYSVYAAPTGVLALAGAVIAWPVHREPTNRFVHGLASAVVIVGVVIALAVAAGLVTVATTGPDTTL
jgi:hypothetical protein